MKAITFRLKEKEVAALELIAKIERRSVSNVVRIIVESYLQGRSITTGLDGEPEITGKAYATISPTAKRAALLPPSSPEEVQPLLEEIWEKHHFVFRKEDMMTSATVTTSTKDFPVKDRVPKKKRKGKGKAPAV